MSGGFGSIIGGGLSLASGLGAFGRGGTSKGDVIEGSPLGVNAFAPVGRVEQQLRPGDQTISRFVADPNAISNQLFRQFPELFQGLSAERERLTPAFNALREAALKQIGNARDRGISNLRDRLAQRRVRGSFSENALIRAEREFGESAAAAEAETELQRIGATTELIARQEGLILNAATKELNELRLALGAGETTNQTFTGSQAATTDAARVNDAARQDRISNIAGGATLLANSVGDFFRRSSGSASAPLNPNTLGLLQNSALFA